MGKLINGQWHDQWYDTDKHGGRFVREDSVFRGQLGSSDFPVEANRYHLYVAAACPWAHRILIMRQLKGLQELISTSFVTPLMLENGWSFDTDHSDPLYGYDFLYQLYTHAKADYTGRVTVPVLWDKKNQTIVNNESAELMVQLNHQFDHLTGNTLDLFPTELSQTIETMNAWIYDRINNGVYKAGFATTQQAYEKAVIPLFEALDQLEEKLAVQPYVCGGRITATDWRLFTTLIRFDAVYHGHFKCNIRRICDYPHLSDFMSRLYQTPGIEQTIDWAEIKQHYYGSHRNINPTGIVPVGPAHLV